MSDLDALLAGIVADPSNAVRWLVMADWLEDHGQPERAELVRVHRELLRTCTEPDAHPDRPQLHARMMELMRAGVQPCLPQKTLTLPGGVELRMSFIPPGSFLMGSPETEAEREENESRHLVTLSRGFWMGQTPVTQAQWMAVMRENPSQFRGDELPVENVSLENAEAFTTALFQQSGTKVRLPTETEWECAYRAGTTTPFYWGDTLNGTQANCCGKYPYEDFTVGPDLEATTRVGSYESVSPHPWGLVDLSGNVWEWCEDLFENSFAAQATAPAPPGSPWERVYRGGGWSSYSCCCRGACRGAASPDYYGEVIGFRLAADGDAFA